MDTATDAKSYYLAAVPVLLVSYLAFPLAFPVSQAQNYLHRRQLEALLNSKGYKKPACGVVTVTISRNTL